MGFNSAFKGLMFYSTFAGTCRTCWREPARWTDVGPRQTTMIAARH